MADRYTLTAADVEGCRKILADLEGFEAKTGGYTVGSVQGHRQSATATVRFERGGDPFVTAEAIHCYLASAAALALVCRKVIAHHETNGAPATPEQQQRLQVAETIVAAAQTLRYALRREPLNVDADDHLTDLVRLVDLYEELEPADGEAQDG